MVDKTFSFDRRIVGRIYDESSDEGSGSRTPFGGPVPGQRTDSVCTACGHASRRSASGSGRSGSPLPKQNPSTSGLKR